MDRTLKNLALVLLLAFLALPLFAQMGGTTAKPLTVQVGGSPLGSVYGPRTINFVSGCTGSLSGSTFQITCSGGGGGSPAGSLYAVQVNNPSGTFGAVNAPTTPNLIPQALCSTPTSGGAATSYTNCLPGLLGRPVTGTTSTDTIQTTDCSPSRVEYVGSVSVAVTLPTATTLGVPNCQMMLINNTTGTNTNVVVTPTTWTIKGQASQTLHQGEYIKLSVDPNSSTNWASDKGIVFGGPVTPGLYGLGIYPADTNGAFQLGSSSNPVGPITAIQPSTASGTSVIKASIPTIGNTGFLLELVGTPSTPGDVDTTDVNGNKVLAGTLTVGGNTTFNGATNAFPNGPVSTGSTSLTATACPSGLTGAWCAAEGSTAGTPTTGVDYIRADSATHTLLCSQNGSAEAACVGGGLSGLTTDGFVYPTSSTAITSTAAAANGQLLIGSTGAAPVKTTLTAGSNITITNGAGSITIAASGGGGSGGGNGSAGSSGTGIVLSGTSYAPVFGAYSSIISTAANAAQNVGSVAQSVSDLQVVLGTALGGSQTLVVTLYDVTAAATEAVTCTVPNSGTTCNDSTHSYSAPAGHLLAWQMVLNTSTATTNVAVGAAIGAASTFSGNTSTATSATSGVASAAVGTPLVADGSGNAEPAAPTTTVGQGGVWGGAGGSLGLSYGANNTITTTSGQAYVQQFNLQAPQVVGHVAGYVGAGGVAETLYVCIYNAAGTSVVWPASGTAANATVNSANTVINLSATQGTLVPGTYFLWYEQAGTTAATFQAWNMGTNILNILNKNATRFGTSSTTVSGTTCPSSIGTLAAGTSGPPQVQLTLEP